MAEEKSKLGWIGAIVAALGFVVMQIQLALSKSKLIKAETKARKLERTIVNSKQDAAIEKEAVKAAKIDTRINKRQKKLDKLYEEIGLLNVKSSDLATRVDASKGSS